jgi:cytochrome c oxidase cbb3-type subunit 4
MDVITLRTAITVIACALFAGIFMWAWSARNKARFDAASKLPFADEALHEASKLATKTEDKVQA